MRLESISVIDEFSAINSKYISAMAYNYEWPSNL